MVLAQNASTNINSIIDLVDNCNSCDNLAALLEFDTKVRVAGTDVDGVLRGKTMSKDKFLSSLKEGFGFCSVIFGWDMHDKTYETESLNLLNEGFSDIVARIDASSFRRIPWDNNVPLIILDFYNNEGKPLFMCPRSLLKSVMKQLLVETGNEGYCGIELEWYNFKESPQSLADKNYISPTPLTPGMFGYSMLRPTLNQSYFDEIYDSCLLAGIPLEALHTETGPGVYEAAITYCRAVEAADRGQLFKTSVKQIGLRHGVIPTFMAKPHAGLPGCGGHIHLSLMNEDGSNAFFDSSDPHNLSSTCRHFIAGLLYCLPYILPMLVPNINSFKRLVKNFWAPVNICWGFENRTAAVRVINSGGPKAVRCEMRVSGADMNCYLALAACMASGLYGIRHQLVCPAPVENDAGSQYQQKLPNDLKSAALLMADAKSPARELFDNSFVDHFIATRLWECRVFQESITDWEMRRYMELA